MVPWALAADAGSRASAPDAAIAAAIVLLRILVLLGVGSYGRVQQERLPPGLTPRIWVNRW
ncbi:hypothetical protein GCM10009850_075220 [Nonomuraea monospora]|uniref:Uncharacterized protein n=1 Tax=Nonomuraea monospora TaxID=568818 RepID=A0ABN3CRK4_9ACTN